MAKKVYCIPYAGGSTLFYSKLSHYLAKDIELVPLELSGRGLRMEEPLYEEFQEALMDLHDHFLKNHQPNDSFIILGYSMGALLAYELTRIIEKQELFPTTLICAASDPPGTLRDFSSVSSLTDEQMIDYYINAGGMEELTVDERELMKCFLPIIRNDLNMLGNYRPSKTKLSTPMSIYSGKADHLKELPGWTNYGEKISYITFEGNHYFLKTNYQHVANEINKLFC